MAYLFGGFPSIRTIYNPNTNQYLEVPHVPLEYTFPDERKGLVNKDNRLDTKITMAIIDSGVISHHPQIKPYLHKSQSFCGSTQEDICGHGTMVTLFCLASIFQPINIPDFITPEPKIISVKVTNDQHIPDMAAVIDAIEFSAESGASVVNISLGFEAGHEGLDKLYDKMAEYDNLCFCCAAGNSGPYETYYPAGFSKKLKNVISVAELIKENREYRLNPTSGSGDIAACPTDIKF